MIKSPGSNFGRNGKPLKGFLLVSSGCLNKIPYTGWLTQQIFLSHSSGTGKSKIKVQANLIPCESLLPGLEIATFSQCAHMSFPQCVCMEGEQTLWYLFL